MHRPSIDVAYLDDRIAAERAALHAFLDERILPLMVERAALSARLSRRAEASSARRARTVAPAAKPAASPPRPVPSAPAVDRPRRRRAPTGFGPSGADHVYMSEFPAWLRVTGRWPSARIVMSMLERELDKGLPGLEINRALVSWGYSIDTAEFTKTRLRHLGVLRFDPDTKAWIPTDAYRGAIPPQPIELSPDDRGRAKSPEEHTGGRLVLHILSQAPPEGLIRQDICNAVVAAGYSYSLGRHGHHQLAFMGRIVRDPETNLWTAVAGAGSRDAQR